jgi:hypothetical protein
VIGETGAVEQDGQKMVNVTIDCSIQDFGTGLVIIKRISLINTYI